VPRYVCAQCGMVWREGRTKCFNCESTERVESQTSPSIALTSEPFTPRPQAPFVPGPVTPPPVGASTNPTYVRVVDVKLAWGSVFELIFKFSIAFLVIDLVLLIVLLLILDGLVN